MCRFFGQGDGLAYEATIYSLAKRAGRLPASALAVPDTFPRWTGGPLELEEIPGLRPTDPPVTRTGEPVEGTDTAADASQGGSALVECEGELFVRWDEAEAVRDELRRQGDAEGEREREKGDGEVGRGGGGAAGGNDGGPQQRRHRLDLRAQCERAREQDRRWKRVLQTQRMTWLWDMWPEWWWQISKPATASASAAGATQQQTLQAG